MNAISLLKKSIFCAAFPILLLALVLSSYYFKTLEAERESVEAQEHLNHSIIQDEISGDLHHIVNDLRLLSSHFELEGFLNTENKPLIALEKEFIAFSELKQIYSQVRLLDQSGKERIRVNFIRGRAAPVPEEALQNKGNRYYFRAVQKLKPGEIYFSPLDLNVEKNKIEQPPKPIFRIGTPLFGRGGQPRGILMLNLSGFFLLKHPEIHFTKEIAQSLLVDSDALYFNRPAKATNWQLVRKDPATLFSTKRPSPEVWTNIQAQSSGQVSTEDGLLIFTSIFPQALSTGKNQQGNQLSHEVSNQALRQVPRPRWIFVSMLTKDFLQKDSSKLLEQLFAVFFFFVLMVGGGTASLLQTRFRRRTSKEKLKKSEARYRQLLENTGYGIEEIDVSGTIVFANAAYHRMLGYAEGRLLGHKSWEMIPPEFRDEAKPDMIFRPALGQSAQVKETQVMRKDGHIIDIEVARSLRVGEQGETLGFISVISDISQRKEAEKQIEKALLEKEMLLKEVHHRVKNNLQMVRSLLYLQAKSVEGERDRERFLKAQERVQTMALIHEQLYRSENISKVHFGEYIYNLVKELKKSYNVDERRVKVTLNLEDIPLSLDLAIPCGLIVNELLTNMMKHAFPGKRKGLISISCRIVKGADILLKISDNGIGLPQNFDAKTSSRLGLHLVSLLVDQIDGEIILGRSGGTCYCILFEGDIHS